MRAGRQLEAGALDLAALLRPDDMLVWGQAGAEPLTLTLKLVEQIERLPPMQAFIGIGWSDTAERLGKKVRLTSYCAAGTNRKLAGRLHKLPIPYSQLASQLAHHHPVLLIQLAAGERPGEYSLGLASEYLADLLPHARLVIGEVNARAPRTGGAIVPASAFDIIIGSDIPLAAEHPAAGSEIEAAVARQVANLIEDGATLQLGLGGIPRAVLRELGDRSRLGLHSGLLPDEIVDLHESGVITNECKPIDTGVSVTGLLVGSARLNGWAHGNAALAMKPTSYTHSPANLALLPRFTAINSAIEIDLTGQINAEVAGGRYVGAVGGAADFLRGAHASRGGLPIVALPSMAGGASRIVARLSGPVSTARADVGLIVTEHGVADLRGFDIEARQRRMIAVAAPGCREALERAIFEGEGV